MLKEKAGVNGRHECESILGRGWGKRSELAAGAHAFDAVEQECDAVARAVGEEFADLVQNEDAVAFEVDVGIKAAAAGYTM